MGRMPCLCAGPEAAVEAPALPDWDEDKFRELVMVRWQKGIKNYFYEKLRPGHFLTAVLCNDLQAAISRCDGDALQELPRLMMFLFNYAPANSWGCEDFMEEWIVS